MTLTSVASLPPPTRHRAPHNCKSDQTTAHPIDAPTSTNPLGDSLAAACSRTSRRSIASRATVCPRPGRSLPPCPRRSNAIVAGKSSRAARITGEKYAAVPLQPWTRTTTGRSRAGVAPPTTARRRTRPPSTGSRSSAVHGIARRRVFGSEVDCKGRRRSVLKTRFNFGVQRTLSEGATLNGAVL